MSIPKKPAAAKTEAANKKIPVANATVVAEPLPKPIDKPLTLWDRVRFFLQFRDAFWSIPLWFCLFWFVGWFLVAVFGYGVASYDPAFVQPIFMSGFYVIGGVSIAQYVVYFNHRLLQRYGYGKIKTAEGIIKNLSKEDFNNLTPWRRLIFTALVYFLYTFLAVWVAIKLM